MSSDAGTPGGLRRRLAAVALSTAAACLVGGSAPASGGVGRAAKNGLIAFVQTVGSGDTANFDIFLIQPDGTRRKNLTERAFEQTSPSWSPDGRMLAFSSRGAVHVMRRNGAAERRIVAPLFDTNVTIAHSPSWSPDGTQLAFVFSEFDQSGTWLSSNLAITDLGGGQPRRIMSSQYQIDTPAWSPHGNRLAFHECGDMARGVMTGSVCSVHTVKPDGSDLRNLSGRTGNYDIHPDWLNRQRVLLVSNRSCVEEADRVSPVRCTGLYSVRWDGTDAQPVALPEDWTGDGELDYFWRVVSSPDGAELLVVLVSGDERQLWRWDLSSDARTRVGPEVTRPDVDWQPICTVNGTRSDDVLRGTAGPDLICGSGGDDVIRGLGGDDVIFGQGGRDRLIGGSGRDIVVGQAGRDRCDVDGKDFSRVC